MGIMTDYRNRILSLEYIPSGDLTAHPGNWRDHPKAQADALKGVLQEVGIAGALLAYRSARQGGALVVIDGHLRKDAAPQKWPVLILDVDDAEADYLLATHDPLAAMATADAGALDALLSSVQSGEAAVTAMLAELAEEAGLYAPGEASDDNPLDFDAARASLADRFLVPPFSVLDARQGYWQDRKRAWIVLGIESELGRGDAEHGDGKGRPMALAPSATLLRLKPSADQVATRAKMRNGSSPARKLGQDLMKGEHIIGGLTWVSGAPRRDEVSRKNLAAKRREHRQLADAHSNVTGAPDKPEWAINTGTVLMAPGTSIFDPVLCELAYTWFTAPGAHILDPFAGGSVRGIVASYLGRDYTGIDLREEQIEANDKQAAAIVPEHLPRWIVGNSLFDIPDDDYDFILTCPPYYDLEVYSDHPEDLSNKEDYDEFLIDYRSIIRKAVDRLRDDRFACVVIGDIRDKKGMYRNFVSDTIAAFMDAGMSLYNEAILITAVGSLSIRVGRQFEAGRKLGKTHQNVLVFVKGDPKRATAWCGPVDVVDMSD